MSIYVRAVLVLGGALCLAGCSSIHSAAGSGDNQAVANYLAHGVNVNAKNGSGQTPLHCAAGNGQIQTAEFLVSKGAALNASDNDGMTPAACAARSGNVQMLDFFLVRKVDLSDGKAFTAAAAADRKETAAIVFSYMNGITPLHAACIKGDLNSVEKYIKCCDVNAGDAEGVTPLHYAARNGHPGIVQLLIANGADINAKDNDGMTPAQYAALGGNKAVGELLTAKPLKQNSKPQ